MTDSSSSDVADDHMQLPRCHLLELPQELLDIITDYAYRIPEGARIIWCKQWERREAIRNFDNPAHAILPFPDPKVVEFLVSKRYFATAAKSYLSNTSMNLEDIIKPFSIVSRDRTGIFGQWITALSADLAGMAGLNRDNFPSLRKLVVQVSTHNFDGIPGKAIQRKECSEQELKETTIYQLLAKDFMLKRLGGLELSFTAEVPFHLFDWSAEEHRVWDDNVQRFGNLIKARILATSAQDQDVHPSGGTRTPARRPLYVGSAVYLDSSEGQEEAEFDDSDTGDEVSVSSSLDTVNMVGQLQRSPATLADLLAGEISGWNDLAGCPTPHLAAYPTERPKLVHFQEQTASERTGGEGSALPRVSSPHRLLPRSKSRSTPNLLDLSEPVEAKKWWKKPLSVFRKR